MGGMRLSATRHLREHDRMEAASVLGTASHMEILRAGWRGLSEPIQEQGVKAMQGIFSLRLSFEELSSKSPSGSVCNHPESDEFSSS